MIDTLTSVLAIGTAFGGYKLIEPLIKKRKTKAEAAQSEHNAESVALTNMEKSLEEWRQLALKFETKLDAKDAKLVEAHNRITEMQQDKLKLREELAETKLTIIDLQHRECRKRGCADREPQTGY